MAGRREKMKEREIERKKEQDRRTKITKERQPKERKGERKKCREKEGEKGTDKEMKKLKRETVSLHVVISNCTYVFTLTPLGSLFLR